MRWDRGGDEMEDWELVLLLVLTRCDPKFGLTKFPFCQIRFPRREATLHCAHNNPRSPQILPLRATFLSIVSFYTGVFLSYRNFN